ncbi:hypothetical protein OHA72_06485 [Dactylosporangium sp. NBC_01737]|uniref:hypothetical protein n=1 Tax=Dactylosporangium sp. NBC_01737 TaxID=2975959 RepID=UPI002E127F58|nr:hypothetical protein OHA72_06485 [Dactylosporangium sp. NBC_01737]
MTGTAHVMAGIGAVLIHFGLGAGLLGGLLVAIAAHREALAKALDAAPVVGCGTLATMSATPNQVVIAGRIRHEPTGTVVAPISGAECAWYRVKVAINPESETPGPVYQWDSCDWFTVADDSGEVRVAARLVDRRLHDEDIVAGLAVGLLEWEKLPDGRHPKTLTMLRDAGLDVRSRQADRHRIQEFRLPTDRQITVLGRPSRDGPATLLTKAAICGVSDRPVEDLRAAAHATVMDMGTFPHILLYTAGSLLVSGLLLRLPEWLTG